MSILPELGAKEQPREGAFSQVSAASGISCGYVSKQPSGQKIADTLSLLYVLPLSNEALGYIDGRGGIGGVSVGADLVGIILCDRRAAYYDFCRNVGIS